MDILIRQHEAFPRVWVSHADRSEAVRLLKACGWKYKGPMDSYDPNYEHYFFVYKPWGKNDLTPEDFAAVVAQTSRTLGIDVKFLWVGHGEWFHLY